MNKYECTYRKEPKPNFFLFVVTLLANSEEQAKQMASALAQRTSNWPAVPASSWNVAVLDTGYKGDAKILDYKKLD